MDLDCVMVWLNVQAVIVKLRSRSKLRSGEGQEKVRVRSESVYKPINSCTEPMVWLKGWSDAD